MAAAADADPTSLLVDVDDPAAVLDVGGGVDVDMALLPDGFEDLGAALDGVVGVDDVHLQ